MRLKAMPRLRFAGQITGVEGYVKVPPWASWRATWLRQSAWAIPSPFPPVTTACGALINHITGGHLK